MSDQGFAAGASSAPSAGAMLRAAREKQGLHIAALAAAIKVAPRKLDALENDRWDELPDATFTRALAQTVCRTLKIDAKPVLSLLPSSAPIPLGPNGGGLNTPFNERSGRDEPGIGSAAIKPMVWIAALLMVAAVAVYLLPDTLWNRTPAADTAQAPGVAASGAGAAAVVEPVMPPTPAASGTLLIPDTVTMAASASAATAVEPGPALPSLAGQTGQAAPTPAAPTPSPQQPAAVQPTPAAAVAPTTATATAPATPGLLQIRTTAASWMEVRDSRNQPLLSRLVQPGEEIGLNGSLPLRLTIGNASATRMSFRGQPVDLASRTRDNVARMELQ